MLDDGSCFLVDEGDVLVVDDVVAGTIGAYDYQNNQIEVGFSVAQSWQGRGFATEALKAVLEYLTNDNAKSVYETHLFDIDVE